MLNIKYKDNEQKVIDMASFCFTDGKILEFSVEDNYDIENVEQVILIITLLSMQGFLILSILKIIY